MLKSAALLLFYTVGLTSARVLTADVEYCTTKCDSICQQCAQSVPREVITCLDETLLEGCASHVILTEAWNVTHYCVATDSNLGGWGFMAPVVRDITPTQVVWAGFEAKLVPTTGPYDVLQEREFPVTVSLEADRATSMQEAVVHTCAIERYDGVSGTLMNAPLDVPASCPNGSAPDANLGCEYQSHSISMNITTPFKGSTPISKSQVLFAILGDSKLISNNGILPPALEKALFTVKHKVYSGSESPSTEF